MTASNQNQNAFANRFGIPIWKGKDVKKFREEFAPKGKKRMTFDELAELLGFNHRSQAKRLEDQSELSPTMSITMEYVKRLLIEERYGCRIEWIKNKSKAAESPGHHKTDVIKFEFTEDDERDSKRIMRVFRAKPFDLEITQVDEEDSKLLHRFRFD